jgi:hypothetical protein
MWKTILNQPYYDESDGGYFSFTQNGSHFVLLDNYNKKGQFVGFSDKQTAWLSTELKKAQEDGQIYHIFLCLHNPPFSTGNDGCNPTLGPIFLTLISQYSKIRAIISGHAHIYQRFTMPVKNNEGSRNVHFLILGGGGKLSTEVLSRWAPIPYRWSSDGKLSAPIFTPQSGYQKIRNDEFIAKYHQKSVLSHNFMQLSIHGDTIQYKIFDWKNQLLDLF